MSFVPACIIICSGVFWKLCLIWSKILIKDAPGYFIIFTLIFFYPRSYLSRAYHSPWIIFTFILLFLSESFILFLLLALGVVNVILVELLFIETLIYCWYFPRNYFDWLVYLKYLLVLILLLLEICLWYDLSILVRLVIVVIGTWPFY